MSSIKPPTCTADLYLRGHGVQPVRFSLETVLTGHSSHLKLPRSLANVPDRQGTHRPLSGVTSWLSSPSSYSVPGGQVTLPISPISIVPDLHQHEVSSNLKAAGKFITPFARRTSQALRRETTLADSGILARDTLLAL